jgi:hypothetical protein
MVLAVWVITCRSARFTFAAVTGFRAKAGPSWPSRRDRAKERTRPEEIPDRRDQMQGLKRFQQERVGAGFKRQVPGIPVPTPRPSADRRVP